MRIGEGARVIVRVRVRVTLSVWSVWRRPTPSYELVPVSEGEVEGDDEG